MSQIDSGLVLGALQAVLGELYEGPEDPSGTWVVDNLPKSGILGTMEGLTSEQASRIPIPGRSSIAGHAHHLRFSLELLERWSRGEDPFADAKWEESWRVQTVTESEWRDLQQALRHGARFWQEAVAQPREWDDIAFTGAIASAAHAGYHLGAIRHLAALVSP